MKNTGTGISSRRPVLFWRQVWRMEPAVPCVLTQRTFYNGPHMGHMLTNWVSTGHWAGTGHYTGFHVGAMWAKWAWAVAGQFLRVPSCFYVGKVGMGLSWAISTGPMLIICGQSGHGLELGNMPGSSVVYKWATWAWVRTGQI